MSVKPSLMSGDIFDLFPKAAYNSSLYCIQRVIYVDCFIFQSGFFLWFRSFLKPKSQSHLFPLVSDSSRCVYHSPQFTNFCLVALLVSKTLAFLLEKPGLFSPKWWFIQLEDPKFTSKTNPKISRLTTVAAAKTALKRSAQFPTRCSRRSHCHPSSWGERPDGNGLCSSFELRFLVYEHTVTVIFHKELNTSHQNTSSIGKNHFILDENRLDYDLQKRSMMISHFDFFWHIHLTITHHHNDQQLQLHRFNARNI